MSVLTPIQPILLSGFGLTYLCFLCDLTIQDDLNPVGGFSLRGCLVSALDDSGVPSGESYALQSHPTGVLLICVYVYVLYFWVSQWIVKPLIKVQVLWVMWTYLLVFHKCSKSLWLFAMFLQVWRGRSKVIYLRSSLSQTQTTTSRLQPARRRQTG